MGGRVGGPISASPAEWQVLLLGLFTGLTIYLGMPIARLRGVPERTRALLSAIAVGILFFLFVDVLGNAHALVVGALPALPNLTIEYAATLAAGFSAGVLLLVLFERLFLARLRRQAAEEGATLAPGAQPSAMDPVHVSTVIAVGIGLHNLSEGLAIGAAYSNGILALATVLVVGFAAHNTTEGFAILGPGMMAGRRYSAGRLAALGLIGGGPTFIGTLLGSFARSDALSILFYGLAAGAILYVILQMAKPMLAPSVRTVATIGVVVGFLLGLATDLVVTIGGG